MPRGERNPEVIDAGSLALDEQVRRALESDRIRVAYRFGKSGAREVVFRGDALRALLIETGRGSLTWVVTSAEGRVMGVFHGYDVIGLWDAAGVDVTDTLSTAGEP